MTTGTGIVSGVRVTHREATVDEVSAAAAEDHESAVRDLLSVPAVEEAFVLQTCHRVEAYVVTESVGPGRDALAALVADAAGSAVEMGHEGSLRHLLRVAAGLESAVLGEEQILGQLRDAQRIAREAGGIGPVFENAVTKAIRVGERARTETAINDGILSLGSAAVEVAGREVAVEKATAVVVGAGEMGRLAAKALAARDVSELVVANRTVENARSLAETVETDARARPLAALPELVTEADLVIAATASDDPVLSVGSLDGETTVVDLGQPRDVDPAAADGPATVHDLDDIETLTEDTHDRRQAAVAAVEDIVDEEFDRLIRQYKRERADAVVAAMYESAERVKEREVSTALSKLESEGEVTDAQREVVASLADALVGQLLAAPTASLREAAAEDDWETINSALRLFDPDFEDGPPAFAAGMSGVEAEDLPDGVDAPSWIAEESGVGDD